MDPLHTAPVKLTPPEYAKFPNIVAPTFRSACRGTACRTLFIIYRATETGGYGKPYPYNFTNLLDTQHRAFFTPRQTVIKDQARNHNRGEQVGNQADGQSDGKTA